ncbi:hypothetical protein [Klebsiella pneumoniae]|uniref:hypothetical protein n=1 Tax=Klebsiella pneumoniae TaxID=573 RepID=UPI003D32BC6E
MKVEDQLVHAHFEAKAALDAGATEAEMKPIQTISVMPSGRDLATFHGISYARKYRKKVYGCSVRRWIKSGGGRTKSCACYTKGITHEISDPDIQPKRKAQQAIGLNMGTNRASRSRTSSKR